jgi:ABC-2 type transport system permease protein
VRYLRLLLLELRLSVSMGMEYRWNFIIDVALSMLWVGVGLVPIFAVFDRGRHIAGWTFEQSLVVVGFFTLLKGVLDGIVSASLIALVDRIRQGTLDFLLLKPVDSQFLASTSRFEVLRLLDTVPALAIFGVAFHRMGRAPSAGDVALAAMLLVTASIVLYSVWLIVICAAFWAVRMDNLVYLLGSLFDFARWPASVFRGVWRLVFTAIIPIALLTTYPAEALLGAHDVRHVLIACSGAAALAVLSRAAWKMSLRHYTSASS